MTRDTHGGQIVPKAATEQQHIKRLSSSYQAFHPDLLRKYAHLIVYSIVNVVFQTFTELRRVTIEAQTHD